MAIISGVVWGLVEALLLLSAIKLYLPKLRVAHGNGAAVPAAQARTAEEQAADGLCPVKDRCVECRRLSAGILITCVVCAALCGAVSWSRQYTLLGVLCILTALGVLGVAALSDAELYIIPNACVLVMLVARGIFLMLEFVVERDLVLFRALNSLIAGSICLLFLLIVARITHGGLGYGDVKLFSGLGVLCGLRAVMYTMVLSIFLCALVSAGLLLTKKKQGKDSIPLAPFLVLGFAIAVILGVC